MDFPHRTYSGPPIDDPAILAQLPPDLATLLQAENGLIALSGGFHLRGACREPSWHSLRAAWEGPAALHRLFPAVRPSDVPFAEEALGDQFLLRDGQVLRLGAETGELDPSGPGLVEFLASVRDDGIRVLNLEPLVAFLQEGQKLEPGQLLSSYPPFCVDAAKKGVTLRAIPSADRISFLAQLARQLKDVPDGGRVTFKVVP
jgi:hypothetical protein